MMLIHTNNSCDNIDPLSSLSSSLDLDHYHAVVRTHFERKGYRVHSGLQFGVEFVLYADDPHKVHSDFCVMVVPPDGCIDWRRMQSLVRSMSSFRKHLIVANIRPVSAGSAVSSSSSSESPPHCNSNINHNINNNNSHDSINDPAASAYHPHPSSVLQYIVDERMWTSEHAPFRQKSVAHKQKLLLLSTTTTPTTSRSATVENLHLPLLPHDDDNNDCVSLSSSSRSSRRRRKMDTTPATDQHQPQSQSQSPWLLGISVGQQRKSQPQQQKKKKKRTKK